MSARSTACAVAVVLVLAAFFAAVPTASAKVIACTGSCASAPFGWLQPPYLSGFTYVTQKSVACGWTSNPVGPSANTTDGYMLVDVGAFAIGCGGANILAQAGLWTQTFTPELTGSYNLTATLGGAFAASMFTALGLFGTSNADGYAIIHMNLYDLTTGEWVFQNDRTKTLYNPGGIDDGVDWLDYNPSLNVVFDATHSLHAGYVYAFYVELDVHAEAVAVGLVDASSVGNFGSGQNGADPLELIFEGASWQYNP